MATSAVNLTWLALEQVMFRETGHKTKIEDAMP